MEKVFLLIFVPLLIGCSTNYVQNSLPLPAEALLGEYEISVVSYEETYSVSVLE